MGGDIGTPRARALGAELRDARNKAGLNMRDLADILGVHHATLARWESGERSPRPETVASFLTATGVNGEHYEEIIKLSRDPDGPHWLGVGMPEQERQLAALLEFERTATRIIDVSPLLVTGLLQTAHYARAIMLQADVPPGEIETRVVVRLGRRDALQRTQPAHLTALVGETALRATIGGRQVMVEQLRYLLQAATWPTVDLRVIPIVSNWHPALEGPFLIVEFSKATPIVHLENRRSALFLHEKADTEAYRQAADRVLEVAMSPEESSELIAEQINRWESM